MASSSLLAEMKGGGRSSIVSVTPPTVGAQPAASSSTVLASTPSSSNDTSNGEVKTTTPLTSKRCSPPGGRSSGASSSANDRNYWKRHLYLLQEQAPRPKLVPCKTEVSRRPWFYDREFHGLIPRETADQLLTRYGEGAFLVRESQRAMGNYTLCMQFNGQTKNYRLYFDGQHFVGEKRFDTVADLVADGLICMFMDVHAADYIGKMTDEAVYEESPYIQYQRMTQRSKKKLSASQQQQLSPAHEQPQAAQSSSGAPAGAIVSAASRTRTRNSSRNSVRSSGGAESVGGDLIQQKAHRFKAHTFRLSYCDYCGNFMWGLVQQGLRCEDCGFAAHRKCSEKAQLDCQPDLRYVKRTFGVDLATLCMAHSSEVPPVVEACVQEMDARGLIVEGVYRVSGSHDDIERLRLLFDTQAQVDLSRAKVEDVHTVAGLLKLYLRMLPQPLVTYSTYQALVAALRHTSREQYDQIKAMRRALDETLPAAHYATLRLLTAHLARVARHSAVNRMTVENLAVIFAPTLLCHAMSPQLAVLLPQQEQHLLKFLLTHADQIFVGANAVTATNDSYS